jgi:hypothetical protein
LQLAPGESVVVRTHEREDGSGLTAADSRSTAASGSSKPRDPGWSYVSLAGPPVTLSGTWSVRFVDGGPVLPPAFETRELASWTARPDEELARFAGTAVYSLEFERPASGAEDFRLDLGEVRDGARVRLNGSELGTLWSSPFQVRVGSALRAGRNRLEVEVTNLAANRVRDLDRRGIDWKRFHDINIVNIDYKPFDASTWPLRDSGLLGPVTLTPLRAARSEE